MALTEQRDLSAALTELLLQVDPGAQQFTKPPIALVGAGDGMHDGRDGHYLQVGHSAIQMIMQSLASAEVAPDEVHAVLDYACGFGRVSRWLRAAFPNATLLAADLDPKAIKIVSELLMTQTIQLTKDLSVQLPGAFDLIWVGSLFTHVDEDYTVRLLSFLMHHLTARGVIVATTHGSLVAHRIATRERLYNLTDEAAAAVTQDYETAGFAFAPYRAGTDYGISVARPDKMAQLAHSVGFEMTFFKAKGWAQHQDCFCFRRMVLMSSRA